MSEEPWHLSKSVPITFIFAIILQTLALVWFISGLSGTVSYNSRELMRQESRIAALDSVVQNQAVTLGRLDENIKAILIAVEKIVDGKK